MTGVYLGTIRRSIRNELHFISFQEADLAITDLSITSDRIQALDFTPSFMNLGKIRKT